MKQQKVILLALIGSAFWINSYAQLKVTSLNNVAIGASSTLSNVKFQVIGNSIFSGSGTVSSAAYIRGNIINSGSTTPDYTWYNNDQTGLFHPGTDVIGFTTGGNERARINNVGQLIFNASGTGNSTAGVPDVSWTGDLTTGLFHPAASVIGLSVAGSEKMRVNSSGQILNSNSTSSASTPDFSWTGDPGTGFYRPAAWQIGVTVGGSEKVRFSWDGKVGIGQTSPTQLLDVNGNAIIEGSNKLYLNNTNKYLGNCYNSDLGLISNNSTWLRIGSNNGIAFWGQTGAEGGTVTNNMFINQYGVGINGATASSTYALEVAGSAHASGSWIGSDKRYKNNIQNIESALNKILKMRGTTYEFNKEQFPYLTREGKNIGFIAQELNEILPEAVMQDEKGFYSVNYDAVIPVLVEAFKEQNKTIEDLKKKTESLTSDLNACCQSSQTLNANTSTNISNVNSSLSQNVPNPFSENTEIAYSIVQGAQKSVMYIFDMQGTLLKTYDNLKAGSGKISINGGELTPGMYLYSLVVDGKEVDTKRMILTK